MIEEKIKIVLRPAADEPDVGAHDFQEGLRALDAALRAGGIEFSGGPCVSAHGDCVPEYLLAASPKRLMALADIFGDWIGARSGRKVRVRIGDLEAEASSRESTEEYFRTIKAFRELLDGGAAS